MFLTQIDNWFENTLDVWIWTTDINGGPEGYTGRALQNKAGLLIKISWQYYTSVRNCGIKQVPCCVRDVARPVLGQHPHLGLLCLRLWRDRLRPRRNSRVGTHPAKAGSKLRNTRHGGGFCFISEDFSLRLLSYFVRAHPLSCWIWEGMCLCYWVFTYWTIWTRTSPWSSRRTKYRDKSNPKIHVIA